MHQGFLGNVAVVREGMARGPAPAQRVAHGVVVDVGQREVVVGDGHLSILMV